MHLLAHSRGTDVLVTALRELAIEAYVSGTQLERKFKVRNIVLMSPDMDADVAVAKIFGIVSDPDMPYGKAPNPQVIFPPPTMRLTNLRVGRRQGAHRGRIFDGQLAAVRTS